MHQGVAFAMMRSWGPDEGKIQPGWGFTGMRILQQIIFKRGELGLAGSVALAAICVGIAFLVRLTLMPLGVTLPFVTFYPAVLLAAIIGGGVAGLSTIALSAVAAWAFFEPSFVFAQPPLTAVVNFGVFALANLLIAVLAVKYRNLMFEFYEIERQRKVLADEVNHRAKNLVSVIISLVGQTIPDKQAAQTLIERIRAFAIANDPLEMVTGATDLQELLDRSLHHLGRDKITLNGPKVRLEGTQGRNLRLVFHEMGTNASKYGALSSPKGAVDVDWRNDDGVLNISWREHGGPKVTAPSKHNFGTRLIKSMLKDINGSLEPTFAETGYCYRIAVPLS